MSGWWPRAADPAEWPEECLAARKEKDSALKEGNGSIQSESFVKSCSHTKSREGLDNGEHTVLEH